MNKPNRKDFATNDGMHAAMRDYARQKARKTLTVKVLFSDSPEWFETEFPRATVTVEYKTPDGETYGQDVDGPKFKNEFLPGADELTAVQIKTAFAEWIRPADSAVTIQSIKWKYAE